MGLEREQFKLKHPLTGIDRGDTNPPSRWNRIDTSGVSSFGRSLEQGSLEQKRIQEVRFNIHQEEANSEEGKKEENLQKQRRDGFEPFVDPNDPLKPPINKERELFVNLYGGHYSQKMELNRKGVERALKIAHLDGPVFLLSLSPNRQRSIGANPDGSVSGKGSLMLGEKIEEGRKDSPLYRVVSIPQGWKIEVNDQKLTEELTGKKLSGKQLQRAFVSRFNGVLKEGLFECVWREKLSSVKDKFYRVKLLLSIVYGAFTYSGLISSHSAFDFAYAIGGMPMMYAMGNTLNLILIRLGIGDRISIRNIDHPLEIFMPQVEIDKVARAFAHLQVKGRRIVRETRE